MTAPSLNSFFSGGGNSFSWKGKPIGTTISGTILAVHPPEQQTDPSDGTPQISKRTGKPKMSVRIDLSTEERDPADAYDDGARGLYVQGFMQGAVSEAIRKAGHHGPPEIGGKLSVTLVERQPNDNPALNPINKFTATYTSPSSQAASEFFGTTTQVNERIQSAAAMNGPTKPDGISDAAWAAMDDTVKRQLASTLSGVNEPPF